MLRHFILFFVVAVSFLIAPSQAQAHAIEDYQVINTRLEAQGNTILATTDTVFAFTYDVPDLKGRLESLTNYFAEVFLIEQSGKQCQVLIDKLIIDEQAPKTTIGGIYTCLKAVSSLKDLKITSFLFTNVFGNFDHFVNITVQGVTQEIIFTPESQVYPASTETEKQSFKPTSQGKSSNFFSVIKRFTGLGIEHIAFGFDHILFLLATILIIRSFKNIVLLVTSFTVAHSVTLILASLGLITLTGRIVEPVIALSIVFMAVRNIWLLKYKGEGFNLKERWLIVFGFGLVHGLGFARALAQIEIPKEYFIPALLTFNVGVEIGQFMILAIVLPYLILMRPWRFRLHTLYGISGTIALISLFWFVERIFR